MSDDFKRQAIFNLIENEGWKLVETFIHERIEGCKTRLLSCKLEEVMDTRTKINTYNSIFVFINEIKNMNNEDVLDESSD